MSGTHVICDTATGEVIGHVALAASQIERARLSEPEPFDRPDPVPALVLGQLAVDRRYQGKGYGRSLALFAMTAAVRFAENIGCFCMFTHPLDDGVRAFFSTLASRLCLTIQGAAWPFVSVICGTADFSRFRSQEDTEG